MSPLEILLAAVLPGVFFLIGVGLIAMGASTHGEFLVAKAGFTLAVASVCAFVFWWSYKTEYSFAKTSACGAVFLVAAITLLFILRWVDEKEVVATAPTPKNAGIMAYKLSDAINGDEGALKRRIEIGDSTTTFTNNGPAGTSLFNFFNKYEIKIEVIDNKVLISSKIGDESGDLIAEIVRNEWKVAPPPKAFDRNYSDDSLEVKDAKGNIVLQVRVLKDRIQLQGEWWDNPIDGIRLIKSDNPAHPGGIMMRFDENFPRRPPNIQPMFIYPSEFHLGELAKK